MAGCGCSHLVAGECDKGRDEEPHGEAGQGVVQGQQVQQREAQARRRRREPTTQREGPEGQRLGGGGCFHLRWAAGEVGRDVGMRMVGGVGCLQDHGGDSRRGHHRRHAHLEQQRALDPATPSHATGKHRTAVRGRTRTEWPLDRRGVVEGSGLRVKWA